MVSEPLAYHHQLAVGDTITLPAATAPAALKVAGIYYSYGSEHGRILIRSSLYQSLWNDPAIGSSAVYVRPGANLSGVIRNIERSVGSMQEIRISRSRDIREASLRVFDRTFTVTGVLRLLAMGVAFIGVLSALMALLLERTREFAILRATGMTGGELGRLICFQTSFLGLCAGVLAIPTGLVLGTILIFVINRRAFGWTMQFHVAPDILLEAVALAVLAALLAGVYPAWRAARTDIASALRTE